MQKKCMNFLFHYTSPRKFQLALYMRCYLVCQLVCDKNVHQNCSPKNITKYRLVKFCFAFTPFRDDLFFFFFSIFEETFMALFHCSIVHSRPRPCLTFVKKDFENIFFLMLNFQFQDDLSEKILLSPQKIFERKNNFFFENFFLKC